MSWTLKKLLRGKSPHSISYLELTAIDLLIQNNFAVTKPVAWGERRVLGIPVEGFLLVEEVPGVSVQTYWQQGDRQLRWRLMQDLGILLGKLNVAGFFAWVRLKDSICPAIPDNPQQPIPLVLIDRECSPTRLEPFSARACYYCLARGLRVFAEVNSPSNSSRTCGLCARLPESNPDSRFKFIANNDRPSPPNFSPIVSPTRTL